MTNRDEVARRQISLSELRRAVADYMYSEGCTCCQNIDAHRKHKAMLGKLLKVPQFPDKSGYDFYRFKSKEK